MIALNIVINIDMRYTLVNGFNRIIPNITITLEGARSQNQYDLNKRKKLEKNCINLRKNGLCFL